MEKIVELIFGKLWPTLSATAKDAQVLVQSNTSFLNLMKTRSDICGRAWLFGVIVALGLGVLGLPALRSAGVKPSFELAGVMTLMNWFLIAIYGVCFGIAARLLRTPRPIMVSVNTFSQHQPLPLSTCPQKHLAGNSTPTMLPKAALLATSL
jgi:hypothetical protein